MKSLKDLQNLDLDKLAVAYLGHRFSLLIATN